MGFIKIAIFHLFSAKNMYKVSLDILNSEIILHFMSFEAGSTVSLTNSKGRF